MKISGNTFIVTGAASGLGEGTARMLAAGGANTVIADLQVEKGEALAQELGADARGVVVSGLVRNGPAPETSAASSSDGSMFFSVETTNM